MNFENIINLKLGNFLNFSKKGKHILKNLFLYKKGGVDMTNF